MRRKKIKGIPCATPGAPEVKNIPPILIEIAEEGVILEDKNEFLEKELAKVRERLSALGAAKKITPRGHYWVLKPDVEPGEVFKIWGRSASKGTFWQRGCRRRG